MRPLSLSKPSKYRNSKTRMGGRVFDSKLEAERWLVLQDRERRGEIGELKCQPRFRIDINGQHVCTVVSDFAYSMDGLLVIEDVKSKPTITALYRLKKKLVRAVHGIDIQEVF